VTLPKFALEGVRLIAAWRPVPLTPTTVFVPCEVATLMFPDTVSAADGLNATFIVWLCPGVNVTGVVKPLVVTSFALTVTCEIVRFAVPLFFKVTLLELAVPAFTLPKAKLVGFAARVTVPATPVPLSAIVEGEPGALLVIEMVPGKLPAVVGAKTALNVALAPAAIVLGVVSPLRLYPAPLTLNCDIVSDDAPVFVSVNVCDFVCPFTTLPNAKLVGAMPNPGCAALPVSEIVSGELFALLVTVTLPVALPPAVGANATFRVAVAAAFNVKGVVIPFTLKPAPLAAMLEICTEAVPVLLNVTCFVALPPVLTLPKLNEVGFACNCPNVADDPVPASATLIVGLAGSLLVIVKVPVAAPAVVGLKDRLTAADCPAVIVFGVVIPLTLNSAPVSEITEIVRSAVPGLDIVRFKLLVELTPTVPN